MFHLVDFQVTIAEILLIIMRTSKSFHLES
nr:truncated ORF6 protein [Severe acute respiratory syndrome coronavirus 2]